jgi:hypothetical protein
MIVEAETTAAARPAAVRAERMPRELADVISAWYLP